MKKTCALTLSLLLAAPGFTQNKADTVKEIVNYGLAVYAQDANSFQEGERRTLDSLITNSDNVSSTSQFLKSKGGQLKNVAANLDEWMKLIDAANGADRYVGVINKISETLKKPHSTDANILKWRAENVDVIFTKPALAYVNTPANGEPITDEENTEEKTPTNSNPATMNSTAVSNSNTLLWIAFTLALLSIIGVAAVLILLRKKLENYRSFKSRYKDETARLWQAIDMLKKEQPAATNTPAPAPNTALPQLAERLALLEKNWKEMEAQQRTKTPAEPVNVPQPQAKKPVVEKQAIPTSTYYAKLADLENGFSEQILSSEQNGEQIYEIITKGNKGRFIITNSTGAQKYALSDYRYYLERACNFVNEPTPNCRIDTKEEGELTKNGASWIIQKKATIQFV